MRRCIHCGVLRDPTEFNKLVGRNRSWCKVCEREGAIASMRRPRPRFNKAKDSAKRRGIPWGLSFETWLSMLEYACTYCKEHLNETGAGLDRLNHDGGYIPINVVPCCKTCNAIRGNVFTPQEMMQIAVVIRRIYRARRRQKHR